MNDSGFDRDDPRLTAHALGELEGEEQAAVEALLAEDALARRFVAGQRAAGEQLAAALAAEPRPELTGRERARVLGRRRRGGRKVLAAAAGLLIGAAAFAWYLGSAGVVGARLAGGPVDQAKQELHFAPLGGSVLAAPEIRLRQKYDHTDTNIMTVPNESVGLGEADSFDTEQYAESVENPWRLAADEPLSTFSIDVDTASYTNVRRFLLQEGRLPPPSAVRIEEFVNYFRYDDPAPGPGDPPFRTTTEVASCPWQPAHRLVRIGLKARAVADDQRPPSNLVFLLDVSGSMNAADKLPLLQRSLRLLVERLGPEDRVAIVVYAGASGLALPSTSAAHAGEILGSLDRLAAGGSTNGGAGIELAYRVAADHFIPGGVNRVVLATDGDFNVGVTDHGSLIRLIEEKRATGVFLSVLGFGSGNLKDAAMEQLADHGNGHYAYIDSLAEARRVLVEEAGGTLVTVAKDVKLQVEFNPRAVTAWRLIGYENRILAHQDFADDTRDAGDVGAGHSVTALYEVVPAGQPFTAATTDPLRYRAAPQESPAAFSGELLFLKLRYKEPDQDDSRLLATPVVDEGGTWNGASADFRFSAAAAAFAMRLRGDQGLGDFDGAAIRQLAFVARGDDRQGRRAEFLRLVEEASRLQGEPR